MLKKLRAAATAILHMIQRLQRRRSLIIVTRLAVGEDREAAGRAQAYAVIRLHQHHPAALSRHELRLLLKNGQRLLAHVGGGLGEATHIFYITFAKFDGVGRIHAVVTLVDRVELLLNDLDLTTWLQLLIELADGLAVDLLHEVRPLLLAITTEIC